MSSNPPRFVSIKVASRRLGLPKHWLQEQVNTGAIPHVRVGRRVRVTLESVEAALLRAAEQEQAGDPDVEHADTKGVSNA